MKKSILSFLLVASLLVLLPVQAWASDDLTMIVDNADLLTAQEEADLEEKAQQLRKTYEYDVVILTVNSLDGKTAQDYADDYYDTHGYGYDADGSGLLFLLAMEEREWYISTCGKAIYTFTDYGIQTLGEAALSYLEYDNYGTVFTAYLNFLPEYFHAYDEGAAIDGKADYSGNYYHGSQDDIVYYEKDTSPNLLLSFVIGLASAGIVILVMRISMNTKRRQHNASSYLEAGSLQLTGHQDLFLYSNVSKVRRQQNNSGTGSGSSVHRSSSGRRHGGGGGKF